MVVEKSEQTVPLQARTRIVLAPTEENRVVKSSP